MTTPPLSRLDVEFDKKTLPSQLWLGEKNVVEAFNGFIIYNDHDIYYFDSLPNRKRFQYRNKKKVASSIESITYLPLLRLLVVLYKSSAPYGCIVLDEKFQISPIKVNFESNPPKNSYLAHSLCFNKKICIYSYHNDILHCGIISIGDTKSYSKVLVSGFDIFLLGRNTKLEPCAKLCRLTYNTTWAVCQIKSWPNLADLLDLFDCDVIYGWNHYLICSFFNELHIIDLQIKGKVSVVKTNSLITSFASLTNDLAIITTDSYEIFFLSMSTLKMKSISNKSLSIGVEEVIILNSYIFLTSKLAGFYIFNIDTPHLKGFIRSTEYVPHKEINLFLGVSHAFKDDLGETFISYTDGYNSVFAKEKLGIKFLYYKNKSTQDNKFIGYYTEKHFLAIKPSGQLCIDNCTPFNGGKLPKSLIDATCFQIYNESAVLYDHHTKLIHIFPGGKKFCVSVEFVPKSIRILTCNTDSIEFALFNDRDVSVYNQKGSQSPHLAFHTVWDKGEPILDLDFSTLSETFYVRTFAETVWEIGIPEGRFYPISENQYFSHIFSIGQYLIGISDVQRTIFSVNHKSSKKSKPIKKFKGNIVTCFKKSNLCVMITTTFEIFEIKLDKLQEYETPLLGITTNSLVYATNQRLIYTTNGLYMVDDRSLDVYASLLIANITDVKVDEVLGRIIVAVWNLEQRNKNAAIFVVFFDAHHSKFEIDKLLTKENVKSQVLVEPINGLVSLSGELYDYRNSDKFNNPVVTLYQTPQKFLHFLPSLHAYAYVTNSKMLVLSKASNSSIYSCDGVQWYHIKDDHNLLIRSTDHLFNLCLATLPEMEKHQPSNNFLRILGGNEKIQWINSSLLLWNEFRERWNYREGSFLICTQPSTYRYVEYVIKHKRSLDTNKVYPDLDFLDLKP